VKKNSASAHEYRKRIYSGYVSERHSSLAPDSISGLMPRASIIKKIISDYFPDDHQARVMDLGCGHGAFVWFIREAGYQNVVGVDASLEQVRTANQLGIQGVKQGDLMEELRAESDLSQDVIISFDVIEHFTKDELIDFVDEVFRVLKQGGKWVIHSPNGESPFFGRIRYGDFTHEQAFTRESIAQLLKSTGFADVLCREDAPIPHGIKSGIRWLLWKCIRVVLLSYLAVETGSVEKNCILSQNFLTVATK